MQSNSLRGRQNIGIGNLTQVGCKQLECWRKRLPMNVDKRD
jgi:hypothetical protein